jgi:hypothetical protein
VVTMTGRRRAESPHFDHGARGRYGPETARTTP